MKPELYVSSDGVSVWPLVDTESGVFTGNASYVRIHIKDQMFFQTMFELRKESLESAKARCEKEFAEYQRENA